MEKYSEQELEEQKVKAKYLRWRFDNLLGEDMVFAETTPIQWYEQRGYAFDEARQNVLNDYRAKLLNDHEITKMIVDYDDYELRLCEIWGDKPSFETTEDALFKRYLDNIARTLAVICDFSVKTKESCDSKGRVKTLYKPIDPSGVVSQIMEIFTAYIVVKNMVAENNENDTIKNKSGFYALEWAAILYYANDLKAFGDGDITIAKIREFTNTHNVETTVLHLKNKYYEVKTRLDYNKDRLDFPIEKLKKIIPFIKKYYPKAVKRIQSDIKILTEKQAEKEKFE